MCENGSRGGRFEPQKWLIIESGGPVQTKRGSETLASSIAGKNQLGVQARRKHVSASRRLTR
jgi:hypothetical protein